MSFDSIPMLDLSLARSPQTKASFLNDLRHALLEVGFLYIKNTDVSIKLIRDVIDQGRAFFDLPLEKKLEVEMKNVPSSGIQQIRHGSHSFQDGLERTD
jgi:isopenicillin N synthase-like dioxygenase